MNRIFYVLLFLLLITGTAKATHERAGEIIFSQVSELTFDVKIITFTYAPSPADRENLEIKWGDGTSSILPRTSKVDFPDDIRRNEYEGQHTYAGQGYFKLSVEDPNRNYGIVNIPNSVNIPFYIETLLVINPFLGPNNSPILLNPPLDYGCIDRLYIHNPAAFDPDGDSLSYRLTVCRGAYGLPIPGYTYPQASNQFTIDEYTGDLIWDKPQLQGEYNVAFIIEEWRNGQRIGYVTRDLQIKIVACENEPPEISAPNDTCITAGANLSLSIGASDPNGDLVILTGQGSPFLQEQSPAIMLPNPAYGNGEVTATFNWATKCSHIQKNSHQLYLKAKDSLVSDLPLTTYKTVNIKVVGPPPNLLEAFPLGNSITINWELYECQNAIGFKIYRYDMFSGWVPGYCETGVPEYTGYEEIVQINNSNIVEYKDENNGYGLNHGVLYCYMVTAIFPDGAESYASQEVCALLKKDLPVITHASVENTGTTNGQVYIAWSKPTELDTIQIPGPYKYVINRREGSDYVSIGTYDGLNDTIFYDSNQNTVEQQNRYRIDLYSGEGDDSFLVGSTAIAPTIFLNTFGTDQAVELSWNNDVPWHNDQFTIYRQNETTFVFDSIGYSIQPNFTDTGLVNGKQYCYKVRTIGRYASSGIIDPIVNYSQEKCAVPVDNVPPCPPSLTIETNCEVFKNELEWNLPDSCYEEKLIYYIYWSALESSDYTLYDSTLNSFYTFATTPPSVVGCFAITALDSLRNQSVYSNAVCVDINECGQIWFPNLITPNGDSRNDFFLADSVNSVHALSLRIFNRWGNIVYETDDPFFRWDGRDHQNNRDCSPGVYFYEGIVSEYSLRGPIERQVRGTVTLLR
ncbi:MAG: gliding motility-associated C-terminal domain-containing protein [Bacteroidales bacterium]